MVPQTDSCAAAASIRITIDDPIECNSTGEYCAEQSIENGVGSERIE